MGNNRYPTQLDDVLLPRPIAGAVARAYGRTVYVLVKKSAWRLGKKLAHTYQRFPI